MSLYERVLLGEAKGPSLTKTQQQIMDHLTGAVVIPHQKKGRFFHQAGLMKGDMRSSALRPVGRRVAQAIRSLEKMGLVSVKVTSHDLGAEGTERNYVVTLRS